jgi:hypothetical protein
VLERQAQQHGVERGVAARQRLRARSRVERAAAAVTSDADLRRGRIEPDDLDTERSDVAGDLAFAASDVEYPSRVPEMASDQREDLLFVFEVGAGGELALPPSGVLFPEPSLLVATNASPVGNSPHHSCGHFGGQCSRPCRVTRGR